MSIPSKDLARKTVNVKDGWYGKSYRLVVVTVEHDYGNFTSTDYRVETPKGTVLGTVESHGSYYETRSRGNVYVNTRRSVIRWSASGLVGEFNTRGDAIRALLNKRLDALRAARKDNA